MAYKQCSSSGIASSWFSRPHGSYKNGGYGFVSAFKKHISSQKTAYYTEAEAPALTEKNSENIRRYALKVQQIIEKGYCNEYAATNNPKCKENNQKTERLCTKTASQTHIGCY